MKAAAELAAPGIICAVCLWGLMHKIDIFSAMTAGAGKGLAVLRDILPALMILFPAVYALRASGLAAALTSLISPLLRFAGIPPETAELMLLRPFTGSGATAAAAEIMTRCGADSPAGRTAAVMLGSSETTFYVISVYFGAAGIKKTRWAVPAAVCADLACFVSSAWAVRLIWG